MATDSDIRAGGAFIEIGGDNKGLISALGSSGDKVKKFAEGVRSVGLWMAGGVGVVTAALLGTTSAFSKLEETSSMFDQVFKENSTGAKVWSNQLSDSLGRGRQQVMDFMAQWQGLFTSMGFSRAVATQMSESLTVLTEDLSSFWNKSEEQAMAKLRSGMVGETEAVRDLGVNLMETAVNQELLRLGIRGGTKDANEMQKAVARLSIIFRQTKDAQGDAHRTAGSWANQTRALAGAFDNLKVAIGKKVVEALKPYLATVIQVIQSGAVWIQQHPQFVAGLLKMVRTAAILSGAFIAFGTAVVWVLSPLKLLAASLVPALIALMEKLGMDTGVKNLANDFKGLADVIRAVLSIARLELESLWESMKYGGTVALEWIKKEFKESFRNAALGAMVIMNQLPGLIPGTKMLNDDALERFKRDFAIQDRYDQSAYRKSVEQAGNYRNGRIASNDMAVQQIMNQQIQPALSGFMNLFRNPGVPPLPNIDQMLKQAMAGASMVPGVPAKVGVSGFFGGQAAGEQVGAAYANNPAERTNQKLDATNQHLAELKELFRKNNPVFG